MTQPAQTLEFISVESRAHIVAVARLARQIWPEHYLSIIGRAQVDYMLACLQSETAITVQLAAGFQYFLLRRQGEFLGYAAVQAQADTQRLFVSKLYLLQSYRQQGIGTACMHYLAELAQQRGLTKLWLTVNKYNPAVRAYLRIGFVIIGEVITDIGADYAMDDYQLEWTPALFTN